jgi:heptosyltransferase-2
MFFRPIKDKSQIKSILVISLSNIGDLIVTMPVIDILKRDFPDADLSVVVGPRPAPALDGNPHIHKVYVFDKHQTGLQKLAWVRHLRKTKFDLVVDLRHSAIPFMIPACYRTSPFLFRGRKTHMKIQHLNRLKSIYPFESESRERYGLYISEEDKRHVDSLLQGRVIDGERFVVMCPGAADRKKRWTPEGFARVSDELIKLYQLKIVFVGNKEDWEITENIFTQMKHSAFNFCGQTTLTQLAELLKRSFFAILNDSGIMHMASYFNVPVVTLFGPTDPDIAAPWGPKGCVVKSEVFCAACRNRRSGLEHICMKSITSQDVLRVIHITAQGVTLGQER